MSRQGVLSADEELDARRTRAYIDGLEAALCDVVAIADFMDDNFPLLPENRTALDAARRLARSVEEARA